MNKADLGRHIVGETGMSRFTAMAKVNTVLSGLADSLARNESVRLLGFRTLSARRS